MKNYLKSYGLFLILLSFTFISKAQINCIILDDSIGCAPFTVNITYCGPLNETGGPFPTIYIINGETIPLESGMTVPYTFEDAGIFDIEQVISLNQVERETFPNAVRVVSTPDLLVSLLPCNDKNVSISIDSNSYDFYVITNSIDASIDTVFGFGDLQKSFSGTPNTDVDFFITGMYFQAECERSFNQSVNLIESILPISIDTLFELEQTIEIIFEGVTDINYISSTYLNGSLQFSETETNNTITFSTLPSNLNNHDSLTFIAQDACENQEVIIASPSFQSQTDFTNNRNITSLNPTLFIPSSFDIIKHSPNNLTQGIEIPELIDSNIICGTEICYSLETEETVRSLPFTWFTNSQCGVSFSNDIPPSLKNISIDNSSIDSTIIILNEDYSIVSLSVDNISYTPVGNTVAIAPENSCFVLNYINACDIQSNDTTYCPIQLDFNTNLLFWEDIVTTSTYDLLWGENSPDSTFEFNFADNQLEFNESDFLSEEFCIFVKNNLTNYISNPTCFKSTPFIFIPDIFSPDGDGEFDELKIQTRFIQSFICSIFNENGNLVMTINEENNPWNGEIDQKKAETGTYFYILQAISETGIELNKKGSLILK